MMPPGWIARPAARFAVLGFEACRSFQNLSAWLAN
jgi:hypothetical protein